MPRVYLGMSFGGRPFKALSSVASLRGDPAARAVEAASGTEACPRDLPPLVLLGPLGSASS
eukprot:2746643-Alexandrium_andersonii.AAC.1